MSGKERWIMAAFVAVGAFYLFEWKALYLYAVAALIYAFTRSRGR